MMWTHWLPSMDDQFLGLCSLCLNGYVSMWPRSVGASPNSEISRGQGAADAGCRGFVIDVPLYSILG